jgi:hypothetical protein
LHDIQGAINRNGDTDSIALLHVTGKLIGDRLLSAHAPTLDLQDRGAHMVIDGDVDPRSPAC